VQLEYNQRHHITPTTIVKAIRSALADQLKARKVAMEAISASELEYDRTELITKLEAQMLEAAEALEFEQAARLRDRIKELKLEEETETLERNTKAGRRT
jgi:excinuclease ABC subunit B